MVRAFTKCSRTSSHVPLLPTESTETPKFKFDYIILTLRHLYPPTGVESPKTTPTNWKPLCVWGNPTYSTQPHHFHGRSFNSLLHTTRPTPIYKPHIIGPKPLYERPHSYSHFWFLSLIATPRPNPDTHPPQKINIVHGNITLSNHPC